MRSSTILVLTLRSLAQETIKNLVLSGVGRLIVMDDKEVTEMDLGAGLLFREDEGAVGQKVSLVCFAVTKTSGSLAYQLNIPSRHSRTLPPNPLYTHAFVASRSGPPANPIPKPARQDRPKTYPFAISRGRIGGRDGCVLEG